MECARVEAFVAGRAEDEPDDSLSLFGHIEGCAACRRLFEEAEGDLVRLADAFEPPVVTEAEWADVRAEVLARSVPLARASRTGGPARGAVLLRRVSGAALAAAAVLLALALVLLLGDPSSEGPPATGRVRERPKSADLGRPDDPSDAPRPDAVAAAPGPGPGPVEVEEVEAGDGYCAMVILASDDEGSALIMLTPVDRE